MRKLVISVLLTFVCVLAAIAALCGGKPEWIAPTSPSPATPGGTVTFRVALDQPASGNQSVSISVDTPSLFSSLPSSVTVLNGQTSATFQGTLSNTATGYFTIMASANGEAVDCEVGIAEPPK
jgi:hypothetical protein